MIFARPYRHQLAFFRIDSLDREHVVEDLERDCVMNIIDACQSTVNVYRYVRPGYVSFCVDRSVV